ncbi:MAG: SGNH/GDSL hydrolase family protein [Phycisphaerae bacterium]
MKNAIVWMLVVAMLGSSLAIALAGDEPTGPVLFGKDEVGKWKPSTQTAGAVEQVDGKLGKAVKFTFNEAKAATFMTAYAKTPAEADECAGVSFWLKGDGSDNFGCLQLIDSTYARRYDYAFPLKNTEWTKITIAWCDFMPVIAGPVIDPKNGFKPSGIEAYFFGKFHYWPSRPAISFTMDTLALEKKIDVDSTDYTPKGDPLERLRTKLKDKKPITFVSMGDSLTDKKHNSNSPPTVKTWAEQLADKLKAKYGSEVKYVNPALGGRTLGQCSVLIPTWLAKDPQPDLVTVFFGGNDYDTFEGQKTSREDMEKYFAGWQANNVDRIRRLTKGSADIILMTTAPGFKRWDTYKPLVGATKAVAKDKKTGLCDIDATFHAAGTAEDALKAKYWHWDNVHMGPKGHEAICEAMMKLIEGK